MHETETVRRSAAERRQDTLDRLRTERDMWVSTAHVDHGPHQVPLWFAWDGRAVWMCTGAASATARNIREDPRVRLALSHTFDVVTLQGEAETFDAAAVPPDAAAAFAEKFGWDPRREDAPYHYLRVTPRTVRAWRGERELRGRVVMREGRWLD
ncbi:pyridoxamine 5'-phosphate oxidase family protein [Streptomyces sp. NPDC049813]|uniref:pyridoxamine 5'-phosphate oxidase family protein n=1 Tax=Streptomyces sp. NPDC049813 TaxID=3365597 RepID=UPI003797C018